VTVPMRRPQIPTAASQAMQNAFSFFTLPRETCSFYLMGQGRRIVFLLCPAFVLFFSVWRPSGQRA
jgi:hypothetical protein